MVEQNKILASGSPESQETPAEVSLLGLSQITERITELQASLGGNLPNYEGLLFTIHKQLSEDEALVHLLTPEQVGAICAGLTRKKNIILVKEVVKKEKKKKGNEVTVDDI